MMKRNLSTIQSGLDNVRNPVGSPLAGIDPHEIVDTRPYVTLINEYTVNAGRGNPMARRTHSPRQPGRGPSAARAAVRPAPEPPPSYAARRAEPTAAAPARPTRRPS